MILYCLKRLFNLVPIGFGIIVIVSLLLHAVPGDPVENILGDYATLEDKQALRERLNLNQPLYLQIVDYALNVVRGNLGSSLIVQKPVTSLIIERLPATIELAIAAMCVAIGLAIPLGVISALCAGKLIDYIAVFFSLLGVAIPNFWLGSLLILIFSIHLDLLPVSERGGVTSYILPALTMGTALSGILCRMMRNSMLDTLREDYVRTARAKGQSEVLVIGKHVLRNACLPLVTIIGLQFGVILTGAVITETIFDWPGLGTLFLQAVQSRDYPLIQGCVLVFSATYLVVNLLTDVTYSLVDPRIRTFGR